MVCFSCKKICINELINTKCVKLCDVLFDLTRIAAFDLVTPCSLEIVFISPNKSIYNKVASRNLPPYYLLNSNGK